MKSLEKRPLITFYGDDTTGSVAVMDVLVSYGLKAVVFLKPPTDKQLDKFKDYQGVGQASIARAKSPTWMEKNLTPSFERLKELGAPIFHYKVCSTLDSSPKIGSIGKAIEIGSKVFGGNSFIFLIGAPAIGRYQLFGNLFAKNDKNIHRLDRHPVMKNHPTTPMNEADVEKHIAKQTSIPIKNINILDLFRTVHVKQTSPHVISFDSLDESSMVKIGEIINKTMDKNIFCIGSQGIEYALCSYWHSIGELKKPVLSRIKPATSMLAISGSCSGITKEQILHVKNNSEFMTLKLNTDELYKKNGLEDEIDKKVLFALGALRENRTPLIYSSLGSNKDISQDQKELIAQTLGEITCRVMSQTKVQRVVVAGGDTSGYVSDKLGIYALSSLNTDPGHGGLCLAFNFEEKSFQIAFKGGQMGAKDYFSIMKYGN